MWGVARDAAFRFHRRVFEDKGSCLIDMALEADCVLRRGGAQLCGQEAAVLVVAIGTLH